MPNHNPEPPNQPPQPQPLNPEFRLVRYFLGDLGEPVEAALERALVPLLDSRVLYVGIHFRKPKTVGLSTLWVSIYSGTQIPYIFCSSNRVFAIQPDGTLGEAQIMR